MLSLANNSFCLKYSFTTLAKCPTSKLFQLTLKLNLTMSKKHEERTITREQVLDSLHLITIVAFSLF